MFSTIATAMFSDYRIIKTLTILIVMLTMASCCIDGLQDCGGCTPPEPFESLEAKKWVRVDPNPGSPVFVNEADSLDILSMSYSFISKDTCVGEAGCCTNYEITQSTYFHQQGSGSIKIMAESVRDVVDLFAGDTGRFESRFLCRLYADTLVLVPHRYLKTTLADTVIGPDTLRMIRFTQPVDTIPFQNIRSLTWVQGRGLQKVQISDRRVYLRKG